MSEQDSKQEKKIEQIEFKDALRVFNHKEIVGQVIILSGMRERPMFVDDAPMWCHTSVFDGSVSPAQLLLTVPNATFMGALQFHSNLVHLIKRHSTVSRAELLTETTKLKGQLHAAEEQYKDEVARLEKNEQDLRAALDAEKAKVKKLKEDAKKK